jgi:outer membrane protein TolC
MNDEDRKWVRALCDCALALAQLSAVMSERRSGLRITALARALIRKGLLTGEDLDAAKQEIETEAAAAEALDSEFQAAVRNMNEQWEKLKNGRPE